MSNKVMFVGWDKPVPGREAMAHELFASFVNLLETNKSKHRIDSYEPVLLDSHGGDLNGFFLIRGETKGLNEFMETDEFKDTYTRGILYVQNFGVLHGHIGDELKARMSRFRKMVSEIR